MFGALLILFLLPFLNQSSISSTTFRLVYGILLAVFVLDVAYLGWLGQLPVEQPFIDYGLYATVYYFLFFMVLFPSSGLLEKNFIYLK